MGDARLDVWLLSRCSSAHPPHGEGGAGACVAVPSGHQPWQAPPEEPKRAGRGGQAKHPPMPRPLPVRRAENLLPHQPPAPAWGGIPEGSRPAPISSEPLHHALQPSFAKGICQETPACGRGIPVLPDSEPGEGSWGAAPTRLCPDPGLSAHSPAACPAAPRCPWERRLTAPSRCAEPLSVAKGTGGAGDALTTETCNPRSAPLQSQKSPSATAGWGKLGCTPGLAVLTPTRQPRS